MNGYHWGAIAFGLIAGLLVQRYLNPLGMVGL